MQVAPTLMYFLTTSFIYSMYLKFVSLMKMYCLGPVCPFNSYKGLKDATNLNLIFHSNNIT